MIKEQNREKYDRRPLASWAEKEYKKLLQEVDLMTHTSVDIDKLIDKRDERN